MFEDETSVDPRSWNLTEPVAVLFVYESDKPPREVPLPLGEFRIGRGAEADVTIKDKSVSRIHLLLHVEKNQITATDLATANGTVVNGARLHGTTELPMGSTLTVGNQRLAIRAIPRNEVDYFEESAASAIHSLESVALAALGAPRTEADLKEAEQVSLLFDIEESERQKLMEQMERIELQPGQILLHRGDPVESLFIVTGGKLMLRGEDRALLGVVQPGESIELLALLREEPSAVSVCADEGAHLLRIPGTSLREALARDTQAGQYLEHILQWPAAGRLKKQLRDVGVPRLVIVELIAAMTLRTVAAGARVSAQGDPVTRMSVINSGKVTSWKEVRGTITLVAEHDAGAHLGTAELLADGGYAAEYRATTDVELVEIDRQQVQRALEVTPSLATMLGAYESKPPAKEASAAGSSPDDSDEDAPPLSVFLRSSGERLLRRPHRHFVRQHDEMDCGAACLAMVSRAYGRKISLATYRSLVHVTREGASMWSLVRAARRTGFDAMGVRSPLKALQGAFLPAIALTKYHFVVIYRVTDKEVIVGDPGLSLRKIPRDEFEKEYSGMALLLRPTKRLYAHPESVPGYRKYLALGNGLWRTLGEILAASFVLFGFGLATPFFSQVIFDSVLVTHSVSTLNIMVIAMTVMAVFQVIASSVRTYLAGHAANRFDTVFQTLVYRHIMRLPLNFFMVRRVGDILTRFQEGQSLRQFFTGEALTSLIQVTSIFVYLGVLSLYSTLLAQLTTLAVPIVAFTSIVSSRKLRRLMDASFPAQARAQGLLVEQLRGLETLKSLGATVAGRWRWEEAFRSSLRARLKVDRWHVLIEVVSAGVERLVITALLYVAARMAVEGDLTVGKVLASSLFVTQILSPVRGLASQWTALQGTAVSLGRVDDVITAAPESSQIGRNAHPPTAPVQGDIEFRDVWFQYGSDLSPWVLKGVNLTIKSGETVAFVGRSGSGKTTLVQLVNLLLCPTRGNIFIDGQDIQEQNLEALRESVGIVMQDSHLFAGTVYDNIAFGRENASLELVTAAARVANAHGFISALNGGYFARLQEGGRQLSGGQRQRINIARALFRRPPILILDEATSALDSESERAVVDAMRVFCRGRTSIIIAHRLSTILHADRIVLLDDGRVLETGTHRELLAKGGAYAQLFGAQLNL